MVATTLILPISRTSAQQVERYALLIGIDEYAQPSKFDPLNGPHNDVELVRKLLEEKYGFKNDAEHIAVLLGPNATRSAIAKAFEVHLIEHAKAHPGAIVVFYFSGHGSQANRVAPGDTSRHDTLVAYDSRAEGGRDIIDNEIVGWFEQLRQYTPNATFILDSCHSGDAIRDIGSFVRRQLPPNPIQSETDGSNARGLPVARSRDRPLTRRQQFTLLSASLADESSYEGELLTQTGPKYHGYFTYYLDQTLRLRPQSTAEQAVQDTAIALGTNRPHPPKQTPQAVGDIERVLFGGPADRDDPFIRISSPPRGNVFEIAAGAANGLKPGAFLAVYAPEARHLSGDVDKIANARVTRVNATTSMAELSDEPRQPFTQEAKVTIVTPYFGLEPLRLHLSSLLNQDTTNDDQRLLQGLAAALTKNQLVTKGEDRFDLAVRRGCVSEQQQLVYASYLREPGSPPCRRDAYYLTDQSGDRPLFDFYELADDPEAAEKLADRAVLRAKQINLLGLRNEQSPMRGKVKITLLKVELQPNPTGGPPNIRQVDGNEDRSVALWRVGDLFQVKIENNSNQDIYAATIMLGSSGAIELISTDPHGQLIYAHTSIVLPAPRRVGLPVGMETYKVIATTSPNVDYRYLEQPGGSKEVGTSPLEWLLSQATNTMTRDSGALQGVSIDDWTTDSVEIEIGSST